MPSNRSVQDERVRQWVGDQVGSIFKVMGQTIGDYFRGCEVGDETRVLVRTHSGTIVHEFMLLVRDKEPEATEAFEFLSTIRRRPINHLPALVLLYEAAPSE